MTRTHKCVAMSLGVAMVAVLACPGLAQQDFGLENIVLDTTSLWHYRMIWETEEVRLDSGEVGHLVFKRDEKTKESKWDKAAVETFPANTSPEWMAPQFDDGDWARFRGPYDTLDIGIKNLLLRGRFEVPDLDRAGQLELSLSFYGGVVVYLNGQELTRKFMPAGEIQLATPAEPYPREVYVDPDGFLLTRYEAKKFPDRFANRTRVLKFTFPRGKLIQGTNVLAIAVHRPPADHLFYSHRIRAFPENGTSADAIWGRLALEDVKLAAPPGSTIVPNFSRPKGFQVWNQSTACTAFTADYCGAGEPLRAVRISGVRNGMFPSQIVAGSNDPINKLKVEVSELKGPGVLPASAVRLFYGLPDGQERRWSSKLSLGAPFDSLDENCPESVPVRPDGAGAVQPIWLNVKIPADAKGGDYTGQVTVSAEGVTPVAVPVKLHVFDWLMPDSTSFAVRPDFAESPESVAMRYEVPLWSDAHWALLDRTFTLLGQLGTKSLYVTCIRRTHFGNEHAMIRWIRSADGHLEPDFSVAEKYLDTAARHLGRIPAVVLYAWEPPESEGHAGFGPGRTHDRDILISVLDPDTGVLTGEEGPKWGTPECRAFWRPLVEGWRKVLEKRGMGPSLAFGLVGDHRPTKQAMDDICASAPKARWGVHSHHYAAEWQGYPAAFCAAVWGIGARVADPAEGYGFGWLNPFWLASYPRGIHPGNPLGDYRTYTEMFVGAVPADWHYWSATEKAKGSRGINGVSGIGRVGADFWDVLRDRGGGWRGVIAGRYPETAWGQLNITYGTGHILGVGAKGPVATVRSEAYRANFQEIEARVSIEKALLDPGSKAKLGEDLAKRCRELLDERIRSCIRASQSNGWSWWLGSGWEERGDRLFAAAAEVAAKLAAK